MANQAWIDLVNGKTEAEMATVVTFDDLKKFVSKQGIKSNSRDSDRYFEGMLVKSLGKSSASSGGTATTSSALVNVDMDATRTGTSKIAVRTFTARSRKPDDSQIKTGILYFTDIEVIAAVAAACGYSIGWNIATSIARWLISRGFDWGSSSVTTAEGRPQPLLIGSPSGTTIKTYIEENLLTRLIVALKEWGLWNIDPSSYTPTAPVIGTTTNYDFRGRFPNIPSKYVDATEQLINQMINSGDPPRSPISLDTNQYYIWTVTRDGTIELTILQAHEIDFTYRNDDYINGADYFVGGEDISAPNNKIVSLRTPYDAGTFYRYIIESDGDMKARPASTVGVFGTAFYFNSEPDVTGVAYDNFGTYRPIEVLDDGSIALGAPTDDLGQVVVDPDAVDLRTGTISGTMPDWWAERILVSTPDLDQPFYDYPSPTPLNDREQYLPITIPGKAIDGSSTQAGSITGLTNDELTDQSIVDTPTVAPRIGVDPNPIPINPPSVNPVNPTLPDGINNLGLIHLYRMTDGQSGTMKAFHDWLWTAFDPDTFNKAYADPMQAIIGCHAIFASPSLVGTGSVVLGNVVTTVTADVIKQYATISCGAMLIKPYFKNINDIVATNIQLFLPFIGFVDIDPRDVIYMNQNGVVTGRYLYVDYNIDFLTGACAAYISTKESLGDDKNYLYQFTGNCSIEIPLTSMNYAQVLRNVISAAGNAVGSLAAPTGLLGAVGAMTGVGDNTIKRSGECGGNAGAMGPRKPYLVITRTVSVDADNRKHFEGLPQNMNVRLSAMSGYTKVKYINLDGLAATEDEKADILAKLQEGVFI